MQYGYLLESYLNLHYPNIVIALLIFFMASTVTMTRRKRETNTFLLARWLSTLWGTTRVW